MHQLYKNKSSKFLNVISILIALIFSVLFFVSSNIQTAEVLNIDETEITVSYNKEELILNNYSNLDLSIGDSVVLDQSNQEYYIEDLYRLTNLKYLIFIFFCFIIFILGLQGFQVLASIFMSVGTISFFTLPLISNNFSPVLSCIFSALLLIPSTFYMTHGVNKKSHLAVLSTIITLCLASAVIYLSTTFVNLTGTSSEEASFLLFNGNLNLDYSGILFGGLLISLLGILDDITITQTSIVLDLQENTKKNIFKRAMEIGKDHIASLTNTIFLIYAGTSLPLLLLFYVNAESIGTILNVEPIAEEIVRSMIATFSLILAVPISTWVAYKFNR